MAQENSAARILGTGREARVEPWAFIPDGLDWRWLSRRDAADRVEQLRGRLAEALDRSPRWAYSPRPSIATLLLDAALLDAGRGVTVTNDLASEPNGLVQEVDDRSTDRVQPGWSFARQAQSEPSCFRLVPVDGEGPDRSPGRSAGRSPGSLCVGDGWGPVSVDELERLVAQVPASPDSGRDIVVTSADLSRFEERCAYSWALHCGAALVVCRAEEVPAAVGWARPTVLWLGTPGHALLDRILSFCGGASDRSKRRALKRLRRVVCVGGTPSEELENVCARLDIPLQVLAGRAP